MKTNWGAVAPVRLKLSANHDPSPWFRRRRGVNIPAEVIVCEPLFIRVFITSKAHWHYNRQYLTHTLIMKKGSAKKLWLPLGNLKASGRHWDRLFVPMCLFKNLVLMLWLSEWPLVTEKAFVTWHCSKEGNLLFLMALLAFKINVMYTTRCMFSTGLARRCFCIVCLCTLMKRYKWVNTNCHWYISQLTQIFQGLYASIKVTIADLNPEPL